MWPFWEGKRAYLSYSVTSQLKWNCVYFRVSGNCNFFFSSSVFSISTFKEVKGWHTSLQGFWGECSVLNVKTNWRYNANTELKALTVHFFSTWRCLCKVRYLFHWGYFFWSELVNTENSKWLGKSCGFFKGGWIVGVNRTERFKPKRGFFVTSSSKLVLLSAYCAILQGRCVYISSLTFLHVWSQMVCFYVWVDTWALQLMGWPNY